MGTSEEYFSPEYLIPWGNDDMRERILHYLRRVQEGELYMQFGGLPLQVDTLAQLGVDGGPDNAISVTNDDLRAVVPREHGHMRALRYASTDQIFASNIFAGLPYEAAAGVTYHVGLRYAAYPTESRLSDAGMFRYVRWTEGIGEAGQPLSVTDNGDGTLTFLVATTAQPGVGPLGGRPWPGTNGGNRLVRLWLVDPRVGYGQSTGTPVGQAVHTAATNSDGTLVTVTVGHTFGQGSAPSTDPTKYRLVVHGPSIWRATDRNLLTFTEGSPAFRPYVYLGSVTDGVADTSAAPSTPSLGIVRFDLLQLAADAFDAPYTIDGDGAPNLPAPLQQRLRMAHTDLSRYLAWGRRPSIHLGRGKGVAELLTWAQDVTVSDLGTSRRLTWNATLPAGHLLVTPDGSLAAGAKMRPCVGLVDDHVDFAEASANGTYVVFLLASETATTPGAETVKAQLTIATQAAWTTSYPFSLALATFTWSNPTLTPTYLDLPRLYMPAPHGESGLVLRDSQSSGGNAALLDLLFNTRPELRVRVFPTGSAVNPAGDPTATVMLLDRPDANTRRVLLPGPQGEGSNLVGGEAVELLPGGAGDIKQRHETGAVFWRKASSGVNKGYLSIAGGGQDANDADGHKPSFWVGDLKLIGTKTVDVEVPLESARGITTPGTWAIDTTLQAYLSSSTPIDAVWISPPWRVGQKLVGFKVRAFIAAPDPGNKITAKITKVDATTVGMTVAYQTLTGTVEWVDTDTTPTLRSVLLATPATLTAGQRFKLELSTSISGGAVAYVTEVLATYRFAEV